MYKFIYVLINLNLIQDCEENSLEDRERDEQKEKVTEIEIEIEIEIER
jgi:hypothetical protein